jgi:hypothetical protein
VKLVLLLFALISYAHSQEQPNSGLSGYFSLNDWEYKDIDEEVNLDWELGVGNKNQEKYEFNFKYENTYMRKKDLFQKTTVTEKVNNFESQFDINKIINNFGLTSQGKLFRQKDNDILTTNYEITFGLGVKLDFFENDMIQEFSISYIPNFNYHDIYSPALDPTLDPLQRVSHSWHHELLLVFKALLVDQKITLSENLSYKQIDVISADKELASDLERSDYIITHEFSLDYNVNDYFSFGYLNSLTEDRRRAQLQNLPSTDHRNSLRFKLSWN